MGNKRNFKEDNKLGQKYEIDELSFNNIDSELKAYCLGFLYADGSLGVYNNDYSIRVHIQESDREVLEFFRSALKTNKPIRKDKNGYIILNISNKQIYLSFLAKGLSNNKTFKIKFPKENCVKNELKHHFIRGYFDGDGSFTRNKRRISSFGFSVVSNVSFLNGLKRWLVSKGFSNVKLARTKNDLIKVLSYTGAKNSKKFYELIYSNSSVFLLRKKNKIEKFILENENAKIKPYKLISPDGIETEIKNFREFSEKGGISKKSIYQLLKKEKESVKGWRLGTHASMT